MLCCDSAKAGLYTQVLMVSAVPTFWGSGRTGDQLGLDGCQQACLGTRKTFASFNKFLEIWGLDERNSPRTSSGIPTCTRPLGSCNSYLVPDIKSQHCIERKHFASKTHKHLTFFLPSLHSLSTSSPKFHLECTDLPGSTL